MLPASIAPICRSPRREAGSLSGEAGTPPLPRVVVRVGGDVTHLEAPCVGLVGRGSISYGLLMGRLPLC